MIRFAELYQHDSIRQPKRTKRSRRWQTTLHRLEPSDAAWAAYFLSGNKLRRLVPTKLLRQWAAEEADIPELAVRRIVSRRR